MASECQAKPAIHQVLDNSSEYDVFWLFITDEMIDLMVVETNRYADQVKEKKGGDATGSLFSALPLLLFHLVKRTDNHFIRYEQPKHIIL